MTEVRFYAADGTAQADAALDAFVRAHPAATPYHLGAWRRAVTDAYGHSGHVLVAERDGVIEGCLPYAIVRRPWGRSSWCALPFCDAGGPLGASAPACDTLAARVAQDAAKAGAAGFEARCTSQETLAEDQLTGRKVRMLLALPDDAEALMQGYPPKLRSQIRKAEKNGLVATVEDGPAAVTAFYDVYSRNMLRLGSPPHSFAWFEAICRHYGADAFIVVVRHEGKAVGAGLVLRCGERAAIPWASTLADYNPLAPNMLLYWTIQSHLCAIGVRQFDFGRSTFGEGTYKFKRQWGAVPEALDWRSWDGQGVPVLADASSGTGPGKLRPLVEKVWQSLPLQVANSLGPRVRRYITL